MTNDHVSYRAISVFYTLSVEGLHSTFAFYSSPLFHPRLINYNDRQHQGPPHSPGLFIFAFIELGIYAWTA